MQSNQSQPTTGERVRVWDLPTRSFHWLLLASIITLAGTGLIGGQAMQWHIWTGYLVAALLLFRLVWGVVGGRWSRFSSFIYSPRTLLNSLKKDRPAQHSVGHSPLGAVSVFALLAVLIAQVSSGMFSDDEISAAGPLTNTVSNAWVSLATNYHTNIGKWLLLALALLHIAAIGYYQWRKQALIAAMLHGDKRLEGAVSASRDDTLTRIAALLIFALCAAAVAWLIKPA